MNEEQVIKKVEEINADDENLDDPYQDLKMTKLNK